MIFKEHRLSGGRIFQQGLGIVAVIVRLKRLGFMAEVGTLAISQTRFKSFKYRKQEVTATPYPGLREFLGLRATRAAYMDKSVDLDIDNL